MKASFKSALPGLIPRGKVGKFTSKYREYGLIGALAIFLGLSYVWHQTLPVLVAVAVLGAMPTLWAALKDLWKKKISLEVFNSFAMAASFFAAEIRSAAFIVLMLSFARILEEYTASKSHQAVSELLKLKPHTALREVNGKLEEVPASEIVKGDILVVKNGQRVPIDGVIIFGSAQINESSLTGESALAEKNLGDRVFSTTLNELGVVKIKATAVGADSTIERMVRLIEQASANKSHTQKLADRFAGIFFPIVLVGGIVLYLVTRNLQMVIALFLVACADDIAVAIPLAMTASLGRAARSGVIIKGGQWLDVLGKLKTLVLDKTGTLTYGSLAVSEIKFQEGFKPDEVWQMIGAAEKFSEQPMGRALYREALKQADALPDPKDFTAHKGYGITAKVLNHQVAIGRPEVAEVLGLKLPAAAREISEQFMQTHNQTAILVFIDGRFAAAARVADVPRPEAKASLNRLRELGLPNLVMLTGDNQAVAKEVSAEMGITEFKSGLKPEDKLRILEELVKTKSPLAMVGDGINDAPALARADVGIAMGEGGTAVAVEAADVVILTDNLDRLPDMVELGRKTSQVIWLDIAIWFVTNALGVALVLTGLLGPAMAAFYNFLTDFLPLINSVRLFRRKKLLR